MYGNRHHMCGSRHHRCGTASLYVGLNREGWTAQQLFDQLLEEEFAQTGGLLPLNPRIQGGRNTPPHLTAELFARSVSCIAVSVLTGLLQGVVTGVRQQGAQHVI